MPYFDAGLGVGDGGGRRFFQQFDLLEACPGGRLAKPVLLELVEDSRTSYDSAAYRFVEMGFLGVPFELLQDFSGNVYGRDASRAHHPDSGLRQFPFDGNDDAFTFFGIYKVVFRMFANQGFLIAEVDDRGRLVHSLGVEKRFGVAGLRVKPSQAAVASAEVDADKMLIHGTLSI